jgi:transposase
LKKSVSLAPVTEDEYISLLKSHIGAQGSQLAMQAEQLKQQANQLKLQADMIISLNKKVKELLSELQRQGIKKDSHNSHLPPSKDLFVNKNKSLRGPSTRKSGGQLGHKGHTLEMSGNPDVIIDLKSNACSKCGYELQDATFVLNAKRQVVDIPVIPPPVYTEYDQYSCQCPSCDHKQIADFPVGIKAPIQYGSTIEAQVSYLTAFQHMPYNRIKSYFYQIFDLHFSEGTIQNLLKRAAAKAQYFCKEIKSNIYTAASLFVGADETSVRVNGQKHYIWVWHNELNTYMIAADNRAFKTIDSVWEDGLPNAILVSDRYAAQLKMSTKGNQVCLAHLLRDAIALDEEEKHPFAQQFIKFLRLIFKFNKISKKRNDACNEHEAAFFENRLNKLLAVSISEESCPKTTIFQNSMLKCRNFILPCIYYLNIPPDNNGSERAIRNIKVKQKVSGQFKSGQHDFCVLRSVIDTFIKRNLDILNSLIKIMDGNFSFQ